MNELAFDEYTRDCRRRNQRVGIAGLLILAVAIAIAVSNHLS